MFFMGVSWRALVFARSAHTLNSWPSVLLFAVQHSSFYGSSFHKFWSAVQHLWGHAWRSWSGSGPITGGIPPPHILLLCSSMLIYAVPIEGTHLASTWCLMLTPFIIKYIISYSDKTVINKISSWSLLLDCKTLDNILIYLAFRQIWTKVSVMARFWLGSWCR